MPDSVWLIFAESVMPAVVVSRAAPTSVSEELLRAHARPARSRARTVERVKDETCIEPHRERDDVSGIEARYARALEESASLRLGWWRCG